MRRSVTNTCFVTVPFSSLHPTGNETCSHFTYELLATDNRFVPAINYWNQRRIHIIAQNASEYCLILVLACFRFRFTLFAEILQTMGRANYQTPNAPSGHWSCVRRRNNMAARQNVHHQAAPTVQVLEPANRGQYHQRLHWRRIQFETPQLTIPLRLSTTHRCRMRGITESAHVRKNVSKFKNSSIVNIDWIQYFILIYIYALNCTLII